MFLVEDRRDGTTNLVFTWKDPQADGFTGQVEPGVGLDYDMEAVHRWPDGDPQPEACVGRAKDNPKDYKVFRYTTDRQAAGYEAVPGTAVVQGSWADYLRLRHPEDLLEEDWFNSLDLYDEAARRRRQRINGEDLPKSTSRDDVAAWVAKTHFVVDTGIREVWYLPQGAPLDEIRLLELNDRFAGNESKIEAIDFGLNVEGAPFHLLVADITSDQLEQIRCDASRLPAGWSLDGSRLWRRRGA